MVTWKSILDFQSMAIGMEMLGPEKSSIISELESVPGVDAVFVESSHSFSDSVHSGHRVNIYRSRAYTWPEIEKRVRETLARHYGGFLEENTETIPRASAAELERWDREDSF
jgi:hypothetical protein